MLKFIDTKSVTVAAAAIIAVGMAIFFILAPPAKAQPQVPAPMLNTPWPRATAFAPW